MRENGQQLERRLNDLGLPSALKSEGQLFSFIRENLTNQKPIYARENLENLRTDWPAEPGIPFDVPRLFTPELESALRSGELGDALKTAFIAGLIQAGQSTTDSEVAFLKQHILEPRIDLGTFTWGF